MPKRQCFLKMKITAYLTSIFYLNSYFFALLLKIKKPLSFHPLNAGVAFTGWLLLAGFQ